MRGIFLRKILFLASSFFDNVDRIIPLAIAQSAEKEVSVIALDSRASNKLRESKIAHQTPLSFLNLSYDDDDLTSKAVTFAKTWYEPFGESLLYKGVSLGEIVEYDFCFLFNDAIRSVEVAKKIMEQLSPNEIVLPYGTTSNAPITTICYEALAPALSHLASLNGIKTYVIRPNNADQLAASIKSFTERTKFLRSSFVSRLRLMHALLSARFAESNIHKKKMILLRIPSATLIEKEIGYTEAVCYSADLLFAYGRPKHLVEKFSSSWMEFKRSPHFFTALKYKDMPLYEILRHRFDEYFTVKLPTLARLCEHMHQGIQALNPDTVVLWDDVTPSSRTLSKLCNRNGIPVLVVQHGAVAQDMGGFHVMPLEAKKQAVWGKIPQEWHVKRGKNIESQVITGNYRFDPIAKGYAVNREEAYRQLGISSNRGSVVVATDYYAGQSVLQTWEMNEGLIRQALTALVPYNDKQIVVKLHPGDPEYGKIVAEIAKEVGIKVILTTDYLWELLSICDLLICSNSTVGMEAMFFAKPVILVNLYNTPEIPYASYGAVLSVRSPEDFRSAIDMALYNSKVRKELEANQERFLQDYTYKRDGHASKRVASLIIEMIN